MAIAILGGAFWLLHLIFNGISLLFLFGLICIILFFVKIYTRKVQGQNAKEVLQRDARGLTSIMLPTLFFISMLVMKDYQHPSGQNPYFTNIDHHALHNKGIAFRDVIDLYTDESESDRGIWDSEGGSLLVSGSESGGAELIFRNFGQPVLAVQDKKVRLLNPVFDTKLTAGFTIRDRQNATTLIWQKVNGEIINGNPRFSFELVVSTSNPLMVDNAISNGSQYTDTVVISGVVMRKGLDLKALLRKANLIKGATIELLLGWADRYPGTSFIVDDVNADIPQLQFFPSPSLINNASFEHKGKLLSPQTSSSNSIDEEDRFYVGLENSRKLKQVRLLTNEEKELAPKATHLLVFDEIAYFPMKAATYNSHPIGKTEVRFLKNTYKQLHVTDIREGFLFHDEVKDNAYTRFDALIEYTAGPATSPLFYKIYGFKEGGAIRKDGNKFSIQGSDKTLTWMFDIRDFSHNKYSFVHITVYLAILIVLMLVLLFYAPGTNLVYIETPLLITTYLLMTYRLLLLWRIATFPPLDNISKAEFGTLQEFDLKMGILFPFPISWFATLIIIASIFVYRKWPDSTAGVLRVKKKNKLWSKGGLFFKNMESTRLQPIVQLCSIPLLLHIGILALCLICFKFLPDWFVRITTILIPVLSYFVCCFYLLEQDDQIRYSTKVYKFKFSEVFANYLKQLIATRIFFASSVTLGFLLLVDTGFGVLFLFFLLFKNVLFPFGIPKRTAVKKRPFNKIINAATFHRLACLFIYLFAIGNKRAFFHVVNHKMEVLVLVLLLIVISILLLRNWQKIDRVLVGMLVLILFFVYMLPYTARWTEDQIDHKIRNVKYRTAILTTPIERMLFEERYSSNKEQKIIETAQNQWFINSYLHAGHNIPQELRHHPIQLLEHFNKGVDYSTQTRDVVLPRFVIGEFGDFTMWMLLALFTVPMILFFFSYKIIDNGRVHTGTYIGAMGMTLLLTLVLFVWLTATNRFVFFGQDFPFLSLTSRLSTLLPLGLITSVLLCAPLQARTNTNQDQVRVIRMGIFTIIVLGVIGFSGRSNLLSEANFRVDFSKVQGRIDEVSEIFDRVQSSGKVKVNLTANQFNKNPQQFVHGVKRLFQAMYADKQFLEMLQQTTIYERSILDTLRVNPAVGFQISSPLHLQYDAGEDRLKMAFNKYWRLELPAYNLREVWKGDILQQPFESFSTGQTAILHQTAGNAEVIAVPASYLAPGTGSVGLLRFYGSQSGPTDQCYVFNRKTREMMPYQKGQAIALLKSDDLVLFINEENSVFATWSMQGPDQRYFAYNFLVNGRQKHIYPLGADFFWARHWSQAAKYYFEQNRKFDAADTIALDFDLNKRVNNYLYKALKPMKAGQGNLTFSVIAADGSGNLRLLADYADQRDRLDPNNDQAIAEKEQAQYFNINTRGERLQWGNLNLLRMDLGPGSSMKPFVAAAVASQLNAGWEHMRLEPGKLGTNSKGKRVITHYAGLYLGRNGWKVESEGDNQSTDLVTYLSKSNNLYHSLFMFLGSYEKEDFYRNGAFSWDHVLSAVPTPNASKFPVLSLGAGLRYLKDREEWPQTYRNLSKNDPPTYFGNTTSLLANGLSQNFDLLVEPATNKGNGNPGKYPFSSLLPDSIMNRRIWAFPEASYFFQHKRTSREILDNFNRGIRFPTQGGDPYVLTPLKMVEMLGKLASLNPLYSVSIDRPRKDSAAFNFDQVSWGSRSNYENFLVQQVFGGMQQVLVNGTGKSLSGSNDRYRNYYIYAKTGTIGNSDNNNSKRLALIICKTPFTPGGFSRQKFYVVYFTIGNAFESDAENSEKNWFWEKYRYILDEIINSASFNKYMNSVP